MKGVILSVNSQARIVDLSHEVPPQDIASAAFTLLAAYRSFPERTVHVAVVDPGVGSSRRPILVVAGGQYFVGPDNGIFSYVIEQEAKSRVFHLTNERYFRQPVSATFHGRDIFAAVAGALSQGVRPAKLGPEIEDAVQLTALAPDMLVKGRIRARIIHIDRFGNCITNLTRDELTEEMIREGARLKIKEKTVKTFRRFFSDGADDDKKLFGLWGSAGFLEIAAMNRSAAKLLKARCGDTVLVSMKE
jgi:S-adenosylmethionine hydrolase